MIPIHKFVGQDILWTPSVTFKHQYELLAGDVVLATLDMSNWPTSAQAVTAEGSYSLQREGFFKQQVMIRSVDSCEILATYTRSWNGGTLQFTDGRIFKWENANFWGTKKAWKDASDTCLVLGQNSPWTRDLLMRVEPGALALPEHPLLVILGLYITILGKRDVAANRAQVTII